MSENDINNNIDSFGLDNKDMIISDNNLVNTAGGSIGIKADTRNIDTKITSQGTQNGMILLNLKSKITKLLTSSNLDKAQEFQEVNNDFLNELKDILSNQDSDSEKALSSRSESKESDKNKNNTKKLISKKSKS